MKKVIIYSMIFIIYMFIDIIHYLFSSMVGVTSYLYASMVFTICFFLLTVLIFEKKDFFLKRTEKVRTMLNYFDFDAIKNAVIKKKEKKERFDVIDSDDEEKNIVLLTIKILNNNEILHFTHSKRLDVMGELFSIIDENVSKNYGMIYNIKDDIITCAFNTLYEIENPDFVALETALNINIGLMKAKERNKGLNNVILNMGVCEEKMDLYIRGNRVILYGDFSISEELANVEVMDSVVIPDKLYKKYMSKIEVEYLGKYYFDNKECKVHRVLKIIEDEEDEELKVYNKSKIHIKKGKENRLINDIK